MRIPRAVYQINQLSRFTRSQLNLFYHIRPYSQLNTQFFSSIRCFASEKNTLQRAVLVNDQLEQETYLFGSEPTQFLELKLDNEIINILNEKQYKYPTLIQAKAIPLVLSGNDVVIGAETGSGKTLSYLLPIIHNVLQKNHTEDRDISTNYPTAIILLPNKDLCSQVYSVATSLVENIPDFRLKLGLVAPEGSREPLPDILICTPSFLSKFIRGPNILDELMFESIEELVLDEADMLLEGGYQRDIENIMNAIKLVRRNLIRSGELGINEKLVQYILAAATIPTFGELSVNNYIKKNFPSAIKVTQEFLHEHHPRIHQSYVKLDSTSVLSPERVEKVVDAILFQGENIPSTMIFLNTAQNCVEFSSLLQSNPKLKDTSVSIVEYHKLIHDTNKQANLEAFRNGKANIMICTDAASRGLDLPNVRHVIQAEFALNVVQHLHRIGRASRAGRSGLATNFYDATNLIIVNPILAQESTNEITFDDQLPKGQISNAFSRRRGLRQKQKKQEKKKLIDGYDENYDPITAYQIRKQAKAEIKSNDNKTFNQNDVFKTSVDDFFK